MRWLTRSRDRVALSPAAGYGAPCGNAHPYQCPVYAKVAPIGALSGQFDYLPLGPFISEL